MNILFIEDDQDLQASGVMQLELRGHKVYPTYDLAQSRAVLSVESIDIDLIISDHRLPDGPGIEFVIEIREQFPDCQCVIVSGCLTTEDIETLEKHHIRYFEKPLLYAQVLEAMRKKPSPAAPIYVAPEPTPEPEAAPLPEVTQKKRRFSFWPRR